LFGKPSVNFKVPRRVSIMGGACTIVILLSFRFLRVNGSVVDRAASTQVKADVLEKAGSD
jgi:hypothetical protein